MIQLFIKIDAATNFEVELDQNSDIALNKSLLEITDIQKRAGDYTKTFLLPGTEKNNTFFGHWDDPGFQGTYNQYAVQRCILIDTGNVVLDGNLKLEGFNRRTQMYEVLVYGTLNTISNILGDSPMSEIGGNWGHTHDRANIEATWNLTVQGGRVLYPLADPGLGYGYGTYDITLSGNPVVLQKLIPGLRLYDLMENLFLSNGIEISNFFDFQAAWDNVYCQLIEDVGVGKVGNDSFTSYGQNFFQILTTNTTIQFAASPANPNLNPLTGIYTAPFNGTYYFNLNIDTQGGNPLYLNTLEVVKNGFTVVQTYIQPQNVSIFTKTFSLVLVATDTVLIRIRTTTTDINNLIIGVGLDTWNLTSVKTTDLVPAFYDPVETLMKSIRQIDFLREFLFMANYIIIRDEQEENKFQLIPLEEWYLQGDKLNWTDKLDISQPMKNSPTNDILSRQVVLSYGDSQDYLNRLYREDTGDNYGTFRQDLGIANSEQQDKKSGLFVPYPTDVVDSAWTNIMIIPKWIKAEDDISRQKPAKLQLFYYNGKVTCDTFYLLYKIGDTAVSRTQYPQCSNYELISGAVEAGSVDLNYGYTQPLDNTYVINGIPDENLYSRFFKRYLEELYDPANRIFECSLDVTPGDISQMGFNDILQIDVEGTPLLWRPQRITDYLLAKRKSTKFKLTKATFNTQPNIGWLMWLYADPDNNITDKTMRTNLVNSGLTVATISSVKAIFNNGGTDVMGIGGLGSVWRSGNEWTFVTWLYEVTNVGTIWMIIKGANVAREAMVFPWTGARTYIRVQDGAPGNHIDTYCTRHAAGSWYQLACTYDGKDLNTGLKIYFNGVAQTLTPGSVGTYVKSNKNGAVVTGELADSGIYSTDNHYFNDYRIWDRELGVAKVLELFNNEKANYGL